MLEDSLKSKFFLFCVVSEYKTEILRVEREFFVKNFSLKLLISKKLNYEMESRKKFFLSFFFVMGMYRNFFRRNTQKIMKLISTFS
jgi:hypothetical protein